MTDGLLHFRCGLIDGGVDWPKGFKALAGVDFIMVGRWNTLLTRRAISPFTCKIIWLLTLSTL